MAQAGNGAIDRSVGAFAVKPPSAFAAHPSRPWQARSGDGYSADALQIARGTDDTTRAAGAACGR